MAKLVVTAYISPDGDRFTVVGREAWALLELVKAGPRGCTPLDNPGPRWSGYIHALRSEFNLSIETIHEVHQGPFPGSHARYVLRSLVKVLSRTDLPDREAA